MSWNHNPKPPSGTPAGGEGWGDANGLYTPVTAETQPSPDAKSAGHAGRAAMRRRMEEKRIALADRLIGLAERAESEQVQLNAINSIFDRLDGKAVQSVVTQVDPFGGWSAEQLEATAEWLDQNGPGSGVAPTGEAGEGGEPT